MKIEHLALWVHDLERMREFYTRYFGMSAGDKYNNREKQYTSYFLHFEKARTRIELMHRPDIMPHAGQRGMKQGIAHFAISVGSREKVMERTERLRQDGYAIISEPRTTGDGYFESVALDPEGNYVEITI